MQWLSSQGMRLFFVVMTCALAAAACARKEPLTAQKAEAIIRQVQFAREPVYAEVPRRVWWSKGSPKDDYDEKALRTLRNLERAGYVTVQESNDGFTTQYVATPTAKGFPILGTTPSYRGPALRATVCYKVYDGLRNFVRHPNDPYTGHAELVWHYTAPTSLYPLFETKINKPIDRPFASHISFYYKDHDWRFDVVVRKTEAG